VKYIRRYRLQSCHFNDQSTYDSYEMATARLVEDVEQVSKVELRMALQQALSCAKDTHGHNFLIEIEVGGQFGHHGQDWLVSDMEMEALVLQWDNTNLSTHPDFEGKRATTEWMAALLREKLLDAFQGREFCVRVFENDDICAQSGRSM